IPEGEIQETYIYVEDSDISQEDQKKYLEFLYNYLTNNVKLDGVKLWITYYDSKLKYPELVGSEHEWCLFERWEIRVEHLTHERRYELVEELEAANLIVDNIPLYIYSES